MLYSRRLTARLLVVRLQMKTARKMAFYGATDHYQLKRMPFELTSVPVTLQHAMNTNLQVLSWTVFLVYLDDIVVFGRT